MRVIKLNSIFYFLLLLVLPITLATISGRAIQSWLTHPFYGSFLGLVAGAVIFFASLIVTYRVFLVAFPFPLGELEVGSVAEDRYKVYMAIWLLFLYPIILPRWIPVPFSGLLYRCLGAKIKENSYFAGVLHDPHFLEIGHHVLGGAQSQIIPHIIEGDRLAHHKIKIGNNVTIGAGAIILPGVTIEDDVMIGAGAVIPKNSHLKKGDIWAGNPGRFIRNKLELTSPDLSRRTSN